MEGRELIISERGMGGKQGMKRGRQRLTWKGLMVRENDRKVAGENGRQGRH